MSNTTLKVTTIKKISNDAVCIYFTTVEELQYKAGQYITLLLNINGREIRRPYSLSSYDKTDKVPFITVKLVENGEATRYLHEYLKIGDELESLQPNGRFVLPDIIPSKLFFFAAGSGISPVISLIKQALHSTRSKVFLVYSNRNTDTTIFYDELKTLEQLFSERFEITWLFSNSKNLMIARLNRSLLEGFIRKHVAQESKSDALFYTCGPFYYMEMIFITLITMGFNEGQLYKETFSLPEEEDEDDGSLIGDEEAPEYVEANITVKYNGNIYQFSAGKNQTILEAALKNKVKLPYSCKNGMCSTCTAQLTSGSVHMHYNQVLTDREVEKGRILTCTSHALEPDLIIHI